MPRKSTAMAVVASAAAAESPRTTRASHSIDLPKEMPEVPTITPDAIFERGPELVSKEEKRIEEEEKHEAPPPKVIFESTPMVKNSVVVPVEVDGESLQDFLQALSKVAGHDCSSLPILEAAKMTYGGGELELEATDLNLWAIVKLKAFGGDQAFQAMLPIARALNIIKRLRTSYNLVKIAMDENNIHFGNYSFPPPGKVEDYPRRPVVMREEALCALPAHYFEEILDRVAPAVSDDVTRQNLCGINLDFEHKVAVATDGHRLHKFKLEQVYVDRLDSLRSAPNVTLSSSFFRFVGAVAGRDWVGLKVSDKQVSAAGEGYAAIMKPVDAAFPPWQQIVPKYKGYWVIDRKDLIDAVKDAQGLCGKEKDKGLTIQVDGITERIMVMAKGPDGERFERRLAGRFNDGPSVLTFGVNPKYLMDAIMSCTGGLIRLAFSKEKDAELSPMTIRGESNDFEAIVTPMRL